VHTRYYQPPIPEEVLAQLRQVSDEWLEIPGRRERQFTLGRFDPRYVRSTPVFAALDKDGQVLAFANLIPSYRQGEAVTDLMRRRTHAPNGIMDYLFIKLFLEKKAQGFERFSLGLAPMAGFQEKEEASPEERAVHAFFQHLNFLFSYRGLRAYKAKFATIWEPRYAVYRNVFDLPRLAIALGKVSEIRD
jgi:phosphatidylglycerol lysyltransferase